MDINYEDMQFYIRHFVAKGCDPEIIKTTEGIFNLCLWFAGTFTELSVEMEKKNIAVARLKEIIFGGAFTKTEVDGERLADGSNNTPPGSAEESKPRDKESKPRKGHGRLGRDAYIGANVVSCQCDAIAGDCCPQCHQGKLRTFDPKTTLHIDGHSPLMATRYEQECLACDFCDYVMTANTPVDTSQKYSEKAKSVLAVFHYGMGLPFYRLARLQAMQGIPIPVSTQSDLMASIAGPVHAVFNHMVMVGAQSDCIYQDDTGVCIQELLKENKQQAPGVRRGQFTSGFIARGEHTVVLYFSGRAHAGENFSHLMDLREETSGAVIRMADALSANSAYDNAEAVIAAKCNAHAFRRFRSLLANYPETAQFVMQTYEQVYQHDKYCKDHQLNPDDRLTYHQQHSGPLMVSMKTQIETLLADELTEPNGVLAAECKYLLKHWPGLTQFLHVAGAPLDNNELEAMLKYMILYRKNSQFFRTLYSADYGSRIISLIVTCIVGGFNAIDYLTELQRHEEAVWRDPGAWMPWSYQDTLKSQQVLKAA